MKGWFMTWFFFLSLWMHGWMKGKQRVSGEAEGEGRDCPDGELGVARRAPRVQAADGEIWGDFDFDFDFDFWLALLYFSTLKYLRVDGSTYIEHAVSHNTKTVCCVYVQTYGITPPPSAPTMRKWPQLEGAPWLPAHALSRAWLATLNPSIEAVVGTAVRDRDSASSFLGI